MNNDNIALIGLVTGMVGAITGIASLIITAIKELLRDRPIIKFKNVFPRKKFPGRVGVPKEYFIDNAAAWIEVDIHVQISNVGLRPTSIVKTQLVLRCKNRTLYLDEYEYQKDTFALSRGEEELSFSNLQGTKLDTGDFIETYIIYHTYFKENFPFDRVKGELVANLSHSDRPIRIKNIQITFITFKDSSIIPLNEVLDSHGMIMSHLLYDK